MEVDISTPIKTEPVYQDDDELESGDDDDDPFSPILTMKVEVHVRSSPPKTKGKEGKFKTPTSELERVRTKRSQMSQEQIEERRRKDRERQKMRRSQARGQLEEIRRKDRERGKKKRAAARGLTLEEYEELRNKPLKTPQSELERKRSRRSQMSEEQLEERRRKERERKARKRAEKRKQVASSSDSGGDSEKEKPRVKREAAATDREEFLRKQREWARRSRARLAENEERRNQVRERERERKAQIRASWTPEQKKEYSQRLQLRRLEKKANMTEEELKEYKAAEYMRAQARKASKSQEEIEREKEKKRKQAKARSQQPKTQEERDALNARKREYRKNWTKEQKRKWSERCAEYNKRRMEKWAVQDPQRLEEFKKKRSESVIKAKKAADEKRKALGLPPKTRRKKNKIVTEHDKEKERVRKFLTNRNSNRRTNLRRRLTVQTLMEKGVSKEEIQRQLETPEQREKRLEKQRKNNRKRKLHKSLVEMGCSPTEISLRMAEFEATYIPEPPLRIRSYTPHPGKMKPVEPDELEELKKLEETKLHKRKKKVETDLALVPLTEASWADLSVYGVSTAASSSEASPSSSTFTERKLKPTSKSRTVAAVEPSYFIPVPPQPSVSTSQSYFSQPQFLPQHHYTPPPQPSYQTHPPYYQQHPQTLHQFSHEKTEDNSNTLYDCVSSLDDAESNYHDDDYHDDDDYEPIEPQSYVQQSISPPKQKTKIPQKPRTGADGKSARRAKKVLRQRKTPWATEICSDCGRKYSPQYIDNHKLFMHNPDYVNGTCVPCNLWFQTNSNYRFHWVRVHKPDGERNIKNTSATFKSLICDLCGERLSNPSSLQIHHKYKHGPAIPKEQHVQCPHCPLTLRDNRSLKGHMQNKHADIGVYPCKRCDLKLATTALLKKHVQETHPDSFFTCGDCGHWRWSPGGLLMHYGLCKKRTDKVGTGKRGQVGMLKLAKEIGAFPIRSTELPCEICELQIMLTSLKRHYKGIHGVDEERFKCWHCEEDFLTREYWLAHMEEDHMLKLDEEGVMEKVSLFNVADRSKVEIKRKEGILRGSRKNWTRKEGDEKFKQIRPRKTKVVVVVKDEESESDDDEENWSDKNEEKKPPKKRGRRRQKLDESDDEEEDEWNPGLITDVRSVVKITRNRRIKGGACEFPNIEREKRLVILVKRMSDEEVLKCVNPRDKSDGIIVKQEPVMEELHVHEDVEDQAFAQTASLVKDLPQANLVYNH